MATPATSVRLDPQLITSARRAARLYADATIAQVLPLALARLAGWPDDVAQTAARIPPASGRKARPAAPRQAHGRG